MCEHRVWRERALRPVLVWGAVAVVLGGLWWWGEEYDGARAPVEDAAGNAIMLAVSEGDPAAVGRALAAAGRGVNDADGGGRRPLELAVRGGNVAVVEYLLGRGAEVDRACTAGGTPLTLAGMSGNAAVVRELLRSGADVRRVTADGVGPVLAAVYGEDVGVVRALLAAGAEAMPAGARSNPLACVSSDADVPMLKVLLGAGVDVNRPGRDGVLPIVAAGACATRSPGCVAVLLAAGADPDRRDSSGRTGREVARWVNGKG